MTRYQFEALWLETSALGYRTWQGHCVRNPTQLKNEFLFRYDRRCGISVLLAVVEISQVLQHTPSLTSCFNCKHVNVWNQIPAIKLWKRAGADMIGYFRFTPFNNVFIPTQYVLICILCVLWLWKLCNVLLHILSEIKNVYKNGRRKNCANYRLVRYWFFRACDIPLSRTKTNISTI